MDESLRRLRERIPADPDVRAALELVLLGLRQHQLETSDLPELIAELARGGAPGFQELLFEPRGDSTHVRYVGDEALCDRAALVRALSAWLD